MTGTDFTQGWVNGWIITIILINLLGCLWLLWWTRKRPDDPIKDGESLGHSFDGIEELNNPLPHWWLNLFYFTIAFAFIYLTLYPGWGDAKGIFGWTSAGQWETEVKRAENKYDVYFQEYAAIPVDELAKSTEAIKTGQRLFANNCAICHGSDARGNLGYPNLTDADWLYGGSPDKIVETITNGRGGMMPPMGTALGEDGVRDVATYILSFTDRKGSGNAAAGKAKFDTLCVACHGVDAKGNQMLGAPNLTDAVWLYGGSEKIITDTINGGRHGKMPAFKDTLSPEKIHVLSSYIFSLSN
ncbi:cytochrome-c oxidase, cbb3-type subunit III [Ketobacter sp. MCCC 1A13808]|uniref:cytochrome-c oxidase, cbb3-type subunit III n=1 Tax=Ketobacter sp. MCCC 1A13808 TaxID=2602738 RepID=UPI000F2D96E6|nr:cytochrome-c oxidase, cbb3-type subunit III [Ketobacter sp. MCCC 1A13808]MVF12671.1 cytochrome-c oxidase, cbb3-type subunit III [Ketobacter sp. MCCC 1A13808]RLP55534.1 MAG: cytochrome-c oxidase, cbb3-type subunit III [Ketobacter sp.]